MKKLIIIMCLTLSYAGHTQIPLKLKIEVTHGKKYENLSNLELHQLTFEDSTSTTGFFLINIKKGTLILKGKDSKQILEITDFYYTDLKNGVGGYFITIDAVSDDNKLATVTIFSNLYPNIKKDVLVFNMEDGECSDTSLKCSSGSVYKLK